MQLISTLALAASASALVAPVAPKASTALKGATLDDQLKKIPGVSPLKNAPADYGFDPLGFAKVSYPRFGLPEDDLLRTNALRDAELRLQSLQNATRDCESGQRDRADHAAAAERRLEDLQLRFDMLQDENTWLNQTAAAKEAALMNEQATRLSLEGSVQSLKEQMSLMQGQLVTAQQQQGTLHKKGGRHD